MKKIALVLALLFLSTAVFGAWTDPVRIGAGNTNIICTWNIAAPAPDTLDAVYFEGTVIRYRRSTDNGVSWSVPETLSNWVGWGKQQAPTIAVDHEGGRHAAWFWWWDAGHEDSSFVYYTRDLGSGWEDPRVIVRQGRVYGRPSIVVDESLHVHVVHTDNSPHICYLRSTDRGTSWESARRVSTGSGFNADAKIATDFAGTIHVAWARFCDVSYRRSTDRGATWETEVHITTGTNGIQSSVACDAPDHVYVTYADLGAVYCRRSTDNGATWENARTIFTGTYPGQTSVACGLAGEVHMFSFARYSVSKDYGVNWSVPENIAGQHASVAVSPNGQYQHVIWHNALDIMYRRNEPSGWVQEPGPCGDPGFLQSSPDPFVSRTRIRYSVARTGNVLLQVYDLAGSEVKCLVDERRDPGVHQAVWDRTDREGRRVPAGVYYCRLVAGTEVSSKKLLVLR